MKPCAAAPPCACSDEPAGLSQAATSARTPAHTPPTTMPVPLNVRMSLPLTIGFQAPGSRPGGRLRVARVYEEANEWDKAKAEELFDPQDDGSHARGVIANGSIGRGRHAQVR